MYGDFAAMRSTSTPSRFATPVARDCCTTSASWAVPNSILDKSGLTPFSSIAAVAGAHHEKLDGSGYWRGLTRSDISPAARILAVADIYEALTAERPYRVALAHEQALEILTREAREGKLWHEAVDALRLALAGAGHELAA